MTERLPISLVNEQEYHTRGAWLIVHKVDRVIRDYSAVTLDSCPSFSGIVAGVSKGECWVNDIDHPTLALVYSHAVGGYAFIGNLSVDSAYEQLQQFLFQEHFPKLRQEGETQFEFSIESESLIAPVLQMLEQYELHREQERHYRHGKIRDAAPAVPEGYARYAFTPENWAMLLQGRFANGEIVVERVLGSWERMPDFFANSLAYYMTYAERVVAVIVGTASFNEVVAIDIYTEEAHRQRGLGRIMTEAFVAACSGRGWTAQWSCMDSNAASIAVAENSSFDVYRNNDVYWIDL